ncbi:MAG: ankyrin repeat domain-containing protein, partial [Candidatus Peregrinibacteria bacterium]|nr:ankyrin repeat domain-containing protein [Candidatus Peregrinibacteria bacterium]
GKEVTFTDPEEIRRLIGSHPDDEFNSYLSVANFLLKEGYDVGTKNSNDQTALFTAIGSQVPEMVTILFESGAKHNLKDKWGLSPLHYACRKNMTGVVNQLLDRGAEINAADGWGFTPAHEAVLSEALEAVTLLAEKNANFTQGIIKDYDKDYPKGTTPLDVAEKKRFTELIKIMKNAKPVKVRKEDVPGKEWTWDKTKWGYEGVHTFEGKLFWYSHSENPLAGGGARDQSFEDFLRNGPNAGKPPDEIVEEVRKFLGEYVTEE